MLLATTALLLFATLLQRTQGDREHKVHNIILYPDKHSWCQTTPIQQVVASPGYEPVTIDNNVCVGACFSYSIPRTQPAEPGELIGPYCDSCQPIESKCYHVTLKQNGYNATFQKRVQIIIKCSCMTCDNTNTEDCDITDLDTSELPSDLFSSRAQDEFGRDEVPDLFTLQNASVVNNSQADNSVKIEKKYELNSKLIQILKDIQDSDNEDINRNFDSSSMGDLIQIIKSGDCDLTDRNLMEFVNYVNGNIEDVELDVNNLKAILQKFEKNSKLLEIHRNFGLMTANNNEKIEQDLKTFNLPQDFGLESRHLHHRHRLGDEMNLGGEVGRLIKGPHGSMVMAPNIKVEEKLNLDSDILKPNHDGTVISYENPLHKPLD